MTILRQHLSLFIPTITILISFHFYQYIDRLIIEYKHSVNQNYSIVIISKERLNEDILKEEIDNLVALKQMQTKGILEQFSDILSKQNFENLADNIPYFYQLKLDDFPNKDVLENIQNILLQNKSIIKVETFLKRHSIFTTMLLNTQKIIMFFTIITFILSIMLMLKIIQVWYFEHKNKLDVMKLFGASLFQRSKELLEISITNAILSTTTIMALFYYLYNSDFAIKILANIGLSKADFNIIREAIISLGISLSISLSILLFLIIKNR